MYIYKVLRPLEWAEFESRGHTPGAPIDLADGYIHLSTATQLEETLKKHFASERGIYLLALESDVLEKDIRWEVSRGGAKFPHLYREMRREDVLWVRQLPDGPDGPLFPADLK